MEGDKRNVVVSFPTSRATEGYSERATSLVQMQAPIALVSLRMELTGPLSLFPWHFVPLRSTSLLPHSSCFFY